MGAIFFHKNSVGVTPHSTANRAYYKLYVDNTDYLLMAVLSTMDIV